MTPVYRLIPANLVASGGFLVTYLVTFTESQADCRQDS
jgi:hypothetical protein